MKQVGNTILAKGGNHILAKRDNSAWPKGSKLSGFSKCSLTYQKLALFLCCFLFREHKSRVELPVKGYGGIKAFALLALEAF